jgi:branched-chain amino acid transport system ATP-binding protein
LAVSLRVEDISVSYGKIQVLWGVSVELKPGEIVSLIGANGAGKSTLLKSIIGLVRAGSGDVIFNGRVVSRQRVHARVRDGMGYVPEGRRLFHSMTVEENLMMGMRRGSPGLWSKVFDVFPVLNEKKKQYAGNLSGGEQQMLSIGRALMSDPKLLLLDELSFGLAPVLFEKVLDAIQEINKSGVSILLAEQNAERALEVSSRSYVIENGKIVAEGMSKDLIDSPAIKAAYLGLA